MSKPTYIKKAMPDNTLASKNHLINQMISLGWTKMQMVISHHKGSTPDIHAKRENSTSTGGFDGRSVGGKTPYGVLPIVILPPAPHPTAPPALMGASGAGGITSVANFSQIMSIQKMRSEDDSFVIGFDTEFYYLNDQRYILSWQFAFVDPRTPDYIEELIVFAKSYVGFFSYSCVHCRDLEDWFVVRMGFC